MIRAPVYPTNLIWLFGLSDGIIQSFKPITPSTKALDDRERSARNGLWIEFLPECVLLSFRYPEQGITTVRY
jgi:hypothetical protein